MNNLFNGVGTAIATPMFNNGQIDYESFKRLVTFQLDSGIKGIIIAGTSGEGSTLTLDEKIKLLKITITLRKEKEYDCSIILGTSSNNTLEAIHQTKAAKQNGADAALIVTPYYNKTSQQGLVAHYYAIADEAQLPIIVYNVPSRTGMTVNPETLAKLAEHPFIVGFKDATGNMELMSQIKILLKNNPDFKLYSGDDETFLTYLTYGGNGIISVTSNVLPKSVCNIYKLYQQGDINKARQIQFELCPLMNAFFADVSPSPLKALLNHLGYGDNALRLPLIPTTEFYRKLIISSYNDCSHLEQNV